MCIAKHTDPERCTDCQACYGPLDLDDNEEVCDYCYEPTQDYILLTGNRIMCMDCYTVREGIA